MQSARGLLYLTLKSARDLQKHDFLGKQQPYCQVDVGKVRVKARTCKDGGQNPEWDETLFFQLSDETEVHVTLFAEHQLSKDACIGTAVIPLSKVRSTGREELAVPVLSQKGKPAGSLNVLLEFRGQPMSSFGQLPGDAAAGRRVQSISQGPPAYTTPGASQPPGGLRVASMPALLHQPHSQQPQSGYLQQAASLGSAGTVSLDSVVQLQRSASLAMQQQSVLAQQQQLQQQQQQLHQQQLQLQQQQQQLQQPASTETPALQQQQQLIVQQQLQHLHLLQQQLASNLPRDLQQQQQNLLMQQQLLGQLASAVHSLPAGREPSVQQASGSAAAAAAGLEGEGTVPLAPRRTAADLFVDPGAAAAARKTAADLFQPSEEGSRLLPVGSSGSLQQELDQLDVDDALLSSGTSVPFSFDMTRLQAIIDKVYPQQALQAQQQQQQGGGLAAGGSGGGSGTTPPSQGAFGAALAAAEAAVASEGVVPGSYFGFGGAAGLLAAEAALAGDDEAAARAADLCGAEAAAGLGQPAAAAAAITRQASHSESAAATAAAAGAAADGSTLMSEGELQRLRAAYARLSRLLELAGGNGAGGAVPTSAPAQPRSAGAGAGAEVYPLAVIERVVGEVTREFDARLMAVESHCAQLTAQLQEREEQLQRLQERLAACEQELEQARPQPAGESQSLN